MCASEWHGSRGRTHAHPRPEMIVGAAQKHLVRRRLACQHLAVGVCVCGVVRWGNLRRGSDGGSGEERRVSVFAEEVKCCAAVHAR